MATITLPGFRSRWTNPAACASASAPHNCRSRYTTRPGGNGPVLADQFLQRRAIEVLHHIVEGAVRGPAVVVDPHRVGVGQRGDRLHFPREAGRDGGVRGQFSADELHGAGPFEQPVFGEPDLAHGALAEFPLQRVLVDLLGPPLGLEGPPLEGHRAGGGENRDGRRERQAEHALSNQRQDAALAQQRIDCGRDGE